MKVWKYESMKVSFMVMWSIGYWTGTNGRMHDIRVSTNGINFNERIICICLQKRSQPFEFREAHWSNRNPWRKSWMDKEITESRVETERSHSSNNYWISRNNRGKESEDWYRRSRQGNVMNSRRRMCLSWGRTTGLDELFCHDLRNDIMPMIAITWIMPNDNKQTPIKAYGNIGVGDRWHTGSH
jgi:hypothetical protein